MNEAVRQLARHRFGRSREALRDGELLLAQGALAGAANRFYYSVFYAARALLATKDVDSSRHSGVIGLFQKHFVKSGMIDAATAKTLPRAFEKRQKSDYGDFAVLTPAEVQTLRDEATRFVDECSSLLERLAS